MGRIERAAQMIAEGAALNVVEGGATPLDVAFTRQEPYLVDLLLANGADPLLGRKPIYSALIMGYEEIAAQMLTVAPEQAASYAPKSPYHRSG